MAGVAPAKREPLAARAIRGAALLGLLALLGCGGVGAPCSPAACPEGTTCDFDGVCRPLAQAPRSGSFTETYALSVQAWGNTEAGADTAHGRPRGTDRVLLGGDRHGELFVAFDVPDTSRQVSEAVLVLFPHPSASASQAPATLAVSRVRRFDADTLTHRNRPLAIGRALSASTRPPVATSPLRLDVREAVQRSAGGPLYLRVSMAHGGNPSPFYLASPDALAPERRPRLEVQLR